MSIEPPGCSQHASPPSPLEVKLPGGAVLVSMPVSSEVITSTLNNVQSMLALLSPALALLVPVLRTIDAALAMKDAFVAIPGLLLGDVESFRQAIDRVIAGANVLASMVPQLSVPVMAKDVVALLVEALTVIEQFLDQVVVLGQRAESLRDEAQSKPEKIRIEMEAQADCVDAEAQAILDHSKAALGPVGTLLALLQGLTSMVPGLPGLPDLDLSGDVEQVKEAITTLRQTLQDLPVIGTGG